MDSQLQRGGQGGVIRSGGRSGSRVKRRFIEMLISHSAQAEGVRRPRKECNVEEKETENDLSSLSGYVYTTTLY